MVTVKCKIDVLAKVLMAVNRAYNTDFIEFTSSNDCLCVELEIKDSFYMHASVVEEMRKYGISISSWRKSGIKSIFVALSIPCVSCNKNKQIVEITKELFDFLMEMFLIYCFVVDHQKCRIVAFDINNEYFVKFLFDKGDFSFMEIPESVHCFLMGVGMAVGISTDNDGTFELIIKQASKAQF